MSVALRPETEQQIREHMSAGRYRSEDDVVQAALKLLRQREGERREDLDEVRRKIAIGLEQIDRGDVVDGERAFEELLADLDRGTEAA